MDIRDRVARRMATKNWTPTDLAARVASAGRRGLSKRNLYDFLHGGKTLNSDALGAVLDALDLTLCLTPEEQARVDTATELTRQRLDSEHAARQAAQAARESRSKLTDADHEQAFGHLDRAPIRRPAKPL